MTVERRVLTLLSKTAILGAPHEVYGEVPVVVVKDAQPGPNREYIKQVIVDGLGPDYAFGDVVFLSEFGSAGFPLNSTSKVERLKLREGLLRLRHDSTLNGTH